MELPLVFGLSKEGGTTMFIKHKVMIVSLAVQKY